MSEVSREEYNQSLERIHQRVDIISKDTIEIKTSAQNMEKAVDKLHNVMFGNGNRDGLMIKVSNLIQELRAHRWFFITIGGGLMGIILWLVRTALINGK